MSAGIAIEYGKPGRAAASFQRSETSTVSFAAVVAALRREIECAGLLVLHEIDPQTILKNGGHTIGATRQILFFHPDLMVRLLEADQAALLEAPLKLAVMEQPRGAVVVRWLDPAAAFARYGNPALVELGRDLAAACERIVAASLDGDAGLAGRGAAMTPVSNDAEGHLNNGR